MASRSGYAESAYSPLIGLRHTDTDFMWVVFGWKLPLPVFCLCPQKLALQLPKTLRLGYLPVLLPFVKAQ